MVPHVRHFFLALVYLVWDWQARSGCDQQDIIISRGAGGAGGGQRGSRGARGRGQRQIDPGEGRSLWRITALRATSDHLFAAGDSPLIAGADLDMQQGLWGNVTVVDSDLPARTASPSSPFPF